MMRALIASAAFLAACGDCPRDLRVEGAAPPLTDIVLAVAAEHAEAVCPAALPFRGTITWTDGDVACGQIRSAGCDFGGGDPCRAASIAVMRISPATDSGLAHELGHHVSDVCGLAWDEYAASAFAESVNREAWIRGNSPSP